MGAQTPALNAHKKEIIMLKLYETGIYLVDGEKIVTDPAQLPKQVSQEEASKGTMAYGILKAHNTTDDMENLKLKKTPWLPMISPTWASSRPPAPPA